MAEDNAATTTAGKDVEKNTEDSILGHAPQPRVNVAATQNTLQFYLARARKILRLEEECTVGGLGQAIGLVVEVVEILKREKVAVVKKVETSMVDGKSLRTRFRKPKIEITLGRGEYATLVSDYRRRKVIDIFETHDPEMTGKLSRDQIEKLNLAELFHSSEKADGVEDIDRVAAAADFLNTKEELDLPEFIRYASILINPLLLEAKFKVAVSGLTKSSNDDLTGDDDNDE
jgi:hypothetical protein